MRGHVDGGVEVVFSDGQSLFVHPDVTGWCLRDGSGGRFTGALDAMTLTAKVVELDELAKGEGKRNG